jgi:hypothetical protein
MYRTTPILVATDLVLLAGGIQGTLINRWTTDHSLEAAATRLERVAPTIGDWKGQALKYEARDFTRAGVVGVLLRRYVNQRTGTGLTLMIVCGLPGPISVHTPEVCYAGAGYDILKDRERSEVTLASGAPPAEFWKTRLRKQRTITPEYLAIHYGWTTTGDWQAPNQDARLVFAGKPFLYKMYVVREFTSTEDPSQADPGLEFIKVLVPQLRKSLFPRVRPLGVD